MPHQPPATTGLPGLDAVLSGIEPGDNIVWEVDAIADYQEFVSPYAAAAQAVGRHLVYFRFADHPALLSPGSGVKQHDLDPTCGFEAFVRNVHAVIESAGPGTLYVFDCLSHLRRSGVPTRASATSSSSPVRGCWTWRP
jgi:pyruvate, water dikinase